MEEDTTLLHSIVVMYANLCTIARTTLLHFSDTTLLFWQGVIMFIMSLFWLVLTGCCVWDGRKYSRPLHGGGICSRLSSGLLQYQELEAFFKGTVQGWCFVSYKTSSSFSELVITTQLRDFHMVSPQVVFTLLVFLTVQSYKFLPIRHSFQPYCYFRNISLK